MISKVLQIFYPSALNWSYSRSREQFFFTVGQKNFGYKIPWQCTKKWRRWGKISKQIQGFPNCNKFKFISKVAIGSPFFCPLAKNTFTRYCCSLDLITFTFSDNSNYGSVEFAWGLKTKHCWVLSANFFLKKFPNNNLNFQR